MLVLRVCKMLCDAHSEKEIETFKEVVPGSPYNWKSTVLYSLGSLHRFIISKDCTSGTEDS